MSGFFDSYTSGSGLDFVGKEEKAELVKDGTAFQILSVSKGPSQFGGDRYIVVVDLSGEERALGFAAGKVESRDRMLDALTAYLEREETEPVISRLVLSGRSLLLEEA